MTTLVIGEEYAALPDPKSYRAAIKLPDSHLWKVACAEAIASLEANYTWEFTANQIHMHLLHSKIVMRKKKDGNEAIERYKAWLVVGGDEQVLGGDCNLKLSAVLDIYSGKVIMAVAHMWGVRARHYDVPSAYFKSSTEDNVKIHLRVPKGMQLTGIELARVGVQNSGDVCLRNIKLITAFSKPVGCKNNKSQEVSRHRDTSSR
uniref:Reverse transcriptase Ty1/copia-type domain-containing protein n=1 Tax=Peronospora matthiolae TaxID=2874970 RepID=A0AAV1V6P3_9STRA